MHILFLTDLHEKFSALENLPEADLVIVGGDFTNFGTAAQFRQALQTMEQACPAFLAVAGNLDPKESDEILAETGHLIGMNAPTPFQWIRMFGVGGANAGPVPTPNQWSDTEMQEQLNSLPDSLRINLLVTHGPAFQSGADVIPNGMHVGSPALRQLATRLQPKLHLCGHIHEAVGIFQNGDLTTVNPGPFGDNGNYADIQWECSAQAPVIQLKTIR